VAARLGRNVSRGGASDHKPIQAAWRERLEFWFIVRRLLMTLKSFLLLAAIFSISALPDTALPSGSTPQQLQHEVARLGGKVELVRDQITRVDLSRSKISDADLAVLEDFTDLLELDLRLTAVSDKGLIHLKTLSSLRSLNLFRTTVTDEGLRSLTHMTKLETFLIGGTHVTDAGLGSMRAFPELKKLSVFDTQCSDAGLTSLAGLKNLQTLLTGKSKITEAGIATLRKSLPNLRTSE
ncbi:MAG: hypothetical protein ABI644_01145, partial [Arenimonas sp.]